MEERLEMSEIGLNLTGQYLTLSFKKVELSIIRLIIPFVTFVTIFLCAGVNTSASDKVVSVYYYPWFARDIHWPDGYLREKLLPPQSPYLGKYSSNSNKVIKQHLEWSQSYGIDNWICSWWGINSNEDAIIRMAVAPVIKNYNTTFCILYESISMLKWQNDRIVFDDADIAKLRSDFNFIARNYFPLQNYCRINNRPVVYLYLTRVFDGEYAKALKLLRQDMTALGYDIYLVGDEVYWDAPNQSRIATFDAITAYNMHGPGKYSGYPSNTNFIHDVSDIYSQYATIANTLGVDFIPNTMPGFNDRAVRLNVNHYVIPNQFHPDSNNVSTFSQFTRMAINHIDTSINAIDITSFNEWQEETQIEPSNDATSTKIDASFSGRDYTQGFSYEGYGTKYLDIVRNLLSDLSPLAVVEEKVLPHSLVLNQNYPNPFITSTKIEFYLPVSEFVTLEIFNLQGEKVSTLISVNLSAGTHQVEWNARDFPGGVYFYRLRAGVFVQNRKLILLM